MATPLGERIRRHRSELRKPSTETPRRQMPLLDVPIETAVGSVRYGCGIYTFRKRA